MTEHGPRWTGKVALIPELLEEPLRRRKPTTFFCSMFDLFHEGLTNEEIAAIFGVMAATPHHTYQVLTKRAERLPRWFEWLRGEQKQADDLWVPILRETCERVSEAVANQLQEDGIARAPEHESWPLPNVWLGVSVESQRYADERIPHLLATPAAVRFLSIEPLLGPVNLHAALCGHASADRPEHRYGPWCTPRSSGIGWVIVGGESGPGAREMQIEWVRSIVKQCQAANVPVFVKQMGAHPMIEGPTGLIRLRLRKTDPKGRDVVDRKGKVMTGWPEDLRVQEMPRAFKTPRPPELFPAREEQVL